ncbi:MAG TPA: hypothetical protein VJ740_11740 [Hyphomicrobiaceae bacterium]|nr:hypothetical protein [Hyphomicrobiaceae bacterium]
MLAYLAWAGAIAFVVALYTSNGFRGRTNELWDKYVLGTLKVGWPYAAIYALYDTITTGALGKALRLMVAGS